MLEISVNYLAVLVAGISNMVIGFLWFGPLFGKQRIVLMGITPDKIEEAKKKSMAKEYMLTFAGALIMAYVLSHVIAMSGYAFEMSGYMVGLTSGFWMWLGFMVPLTLSAVVWEGKSWKLWFLTNSYWLLSLLVMGVIVSVWQ